MNSISASRALRAVALGTAGALLGLLSGCARFTPTGGFINLITPYRVDVVQGNVVTSEQMDRIKPGFTRNQVCDVLGSPMLTDIFHANRWDYVFTYKRPGSELQKRDVIITFEDDKVKSIDKPDLPTEREFVASIARNKLPEKPRKLELSEEERKRLPAPTQRQVAAAAAAEAAAEGPARDYPPLEPR
jgi:outer membrane protein assembly factor BamE